MRAPFLCALLVLSTAAFVIGQDTNFASGPQYLMSGSPLFARSISTPSLSLAGPPLDTGASNATEGLTAGADNQTASPRPPAEPNLFTIYYGGAAPNAIQIKLSDTSPPPPPELSSRLLHTRLS